MLDVYISDKTLEKIWLESCDSNWGKILSKQREIYVLEENPEDFFNENGVLWQIEQSGIHLTPSTDYIQDVINGRKLISEKPFGVFILDISPEEALNMQRRSGVLCVSSDDIYKETFQDILTFVDPSEKNYEENEAGDWDDILEGINAKSFVSNSVIINDRNLFTNDGLKTNRKGEKYEDTTGINNVAKILDKIIPDSLEVPYHVAILCDYECVNNEFTQRKIVEKVNKLKRDILKRQFPIEIEILFIKRGDKRITDATHNRRIISNYFIIKAEHKICAFKNGRSTCSQNISVEKLYSKGLWDRSDSPIKGYESDIKKFKTIIKIFRESNSSVYYLGQNGQEKSITEFKNRLLL